jgi:hypothetical protein
MDIHDGLRFFAVMETNVHLLISLFVILVKMNLP